MPKPTEGLCYAFLPIRLLACAEGGILLLQKCTALYSPIIVFGIVFSFLFGNIISYAKEGVMHGKMANWFLQRVNKDNDFDGNRKNSDRA